MTEFDDDWTTGDDGYFGDALESEFDCETITCQNCGRNFFDDSDLCPHCGEFVIRSTNVLDGKPRWYVFLALLGCVAVILSMLMAF